MYYETPLNQIVDYILSHPDLSKEMFDEIKRKYFVKKNGPDDYVSCSKQNITLNFKKIYTPLTLLDESRIFAQEYHLLNTYFKTKSDEYGEYTVQTFKLVYFLRKYLYIINLILFIFSYSNMFLKIYFQEHIDYYYYILCFIPVYISYFMIYFSGKEKEINNKLINIQLKIDIVCFTWINYMLNSNVFQDTKRDLFRKELKYFVYLTQLSYFPFTRIYNLEMKLICEKLNINYNKTVLDAINNIDSIEILQPKDRPMAHFTF